MSDDAASPEGVALAPLPAARLNSPRAAEATSPTFSEPRTPPPRAATASPGRAPQRPLRLHLNTAIQKAWRRVLEVLGCAGSSARRERLRRLVQYLTIVVLSLFQIVVIAVLTALASVRVSPRPEHPRQTELGACPTLAAWNLAWLLRLVLKVYLVSWQFFWGRPITPSWLLLWQGRQRSFSSEPICPLTWKALHVLIEKIDPFITAIWFCSALLVVGQHGARCRWTAPDVSAATYIILVVVFAHFAYLVLTAIVKAWMEWLRREEELTIGQKLSPEEVEQIPLVLYIPPPPGAAPNSPSPTSPIALPPSALAHPASPRTTAASPVQRRRFVFLRRKTVGMDVESGPAADDEWDRAFSPAPYPLVRLPDHRATCGICLDDFEAPPRLSSDSYSRESGGTVTREQITEVRVESPTPMDAAALQLADSGDNDAPAPLRLLSCGHVYHKRCVDRWLTENSCQCPHCKARVKVSAARRGTV